ncbi:MAG: RNA polymerase sigma factor [Pyrinomonadaceae bacterium]
MAGKEPASKASRDDAEERLLIEAAQRDPASFAELYEDNFQLVYAYIARRVVDREAAEDFTSEVFHKALEYLPRFTWRGVPFGAWLLKIAANIVADQRKRAGREQNVSDLEEVAKNTGFTDVTDMSQNSLEEIEHSAHLFRMVGHLPEDQRKVIVLRFGDEKSRRGADG